MCVQHTICIIPNEYDYLNCSRNCNALFENESGKFTESNPAAVTVLLDLCQPIHIFDSLVCSVHGNTVLAYGHALLLCIV